MTSKELDYLKTHNHDIYKLFEISKDASDATIRRAYRKQALIYHPDKNPSPEAAERFHALSIALKVLNDKQLRSDYDNWIQSKQLEILRTEQLDASRRQMKTELEKAENEASLRNKSNSFSGTGWNRRAANESSNKFGVDLEELRFEGARKRRDLEEEIRAKYDHNREELDAQPSKILKFESTEDNTTVKVRWKIKEGISQLFTSDVLGGILSVFGEVARAEINPRSSKDTRYDTGLVTFKSETSARKAVTHDFSRKSKVWEGTSYRKLSGLLREVKWNKQIQRVGKVGVLNQDELTFDEYLHLTLQKLTDAKDATSLKRKFEE